MVLTVMLPKELHQKIDRVKQETGLSKSYIVRRILLDHFKKGKAA